jgi:signal recognition particle subunit SRP54
MFDTIARTFSSLASSLSREKKISPEITKKIIQQVSDALLGADVPYDVVQAFIGAMHEGIEAIKPVKGLKADEQVFAFLYEKVLAFLGGNQSAFSFQLPSVIMVMGLQGSGKTTTVAKLAQFVHQEAHKRKKKRNILLASIDFYRPAAVDQLEILARSAGSDFYRAQSSQPVAAAQEIYQYYKKNNFELLFLDTAGRLHIDKTMLEELSLVQTALKPQYKLLVLDAMTGQESLAVAKAFDVAVGFDQAILTKMDSDTRGGAAFAFRYALGKPIIFAGSGEKVTDLQPFFPDRIARRMLDIGDLEALSERIEHVLGVQEAEEANMLMEDSFTLHDFAEQIKSMHKVGSMAQIAQYLPGMSGKVRQEDFDRGDRELKKTCAIINSMTAHERRNTKILNGSRKARIAKGAGVSLADIQQMLKQFEEIKEFAKMVKKMQNPLKKLFR